MCSLGVFLNSSVVSFLGKNTSHTQQEEEIKNLSHTTKKKKKKPLAHNRRKKRKKKPLTKTKKKKNERRTCHILIQLTIVYGSVRFERVKTKPFKFFQIVKPLKPRFRGLVSVFSLGQF